jgi:hypothetical protein
MNILECIDYLINENIIKNSLENIGKFFKIHDFKDIKHIDDLIKPENGTYTGKLVDLLNNGKYSHKISDLFARNNPDVKQQFLQNLYIKINNNREKFISNNKINIKELNNNFKEALDLSSFDSIPNRDTATKIANKLFKSDAENLYHDHKTLANVVGGTAVTGLGVGGAAVLMPKPESTAFLTTDPTQPINIPIDTHSSLTNPLLVGALGTGAAYGIYKYIKNKYDNQRMHE